MFTSQNIHHFNIPPDSNFDPKKLKNKTRNVKLQTKQQNCVESQNQTHQPQTIATDTSDLKESLFESLEANYPDQYLQQEKFKNSENLNFSPRFETKQDTDFINLLPFLRKAESIGFGFLTQLGWGFFLALNFFKK